MAMAEVLSPTLAPAARVDGRSPHQLRPIRFHNHIAPSALGSTLIEWGQTRLICAVSLDPTVPRWKKDQGLPGGWLTAEYSMLPYSTLPRKPREITKGRPEGRTQEIQRLIGRALRTALDLEKLGERTLWVDCDVLQADGGTRTAAITGGYVALALAIQRLLQEGVLTESPLLAPVAAVSVGLVEGQVLLDLCYREDLVAAVDLNLVMNQAGQFIEIQGSGEEATFTQEQLLQMIDLGKTGIAQILQAQQRALTRTEPNPAPAPNPTP